MAKSEVKVIEIGALVRARRMTWHKLEDRPHAGKTLPQVVFEAPEYVFDGQEAGKFDGPLLAEAAEVCRRASRIWASGKDPRSVTVFYYLHSFYPDRFGGCTVVSNADRRLGQYRKVSAAESPFFDLWLPRRIAPKDWRAAHLLLLDVRLVHFGHPTAVVTHRQAESFFENPNCIAD